MKNIIHEISYINIKKLHYEFREQNDLKLFSFIHDNLITSNG